MDQRLKTEEALRLATSRIKLGAIAGVTRQATQQWGVFVPKKRMPAILKIYPNCLDVARSDVNS